VSHQIYKAPVAMICGNLVSTLAARRQALGMTQAVLARNMRTTPQHLSRLETGMEQPQLRMLVQWARELGLHVRLLDLRNQPRRGPWR